MPSCFMVKKHHFKQKLLLWPQIPFNKEFLTKKLMGVSIYKKRLQDLLNQQKNWPSMHSPMHLINHQLLGTFVKIFINQSKN